MLSKSPKVSVVIPVRNGREYIHEAIASVCDQDFDDLELIIIDDGSNDFEYSSLEKLDSRIQVKRLTGLGVSAARNVGMGLSSGQYIAFLDADDAWYPGKLKAQIDYFERNPQVGCVFGAFKKWHPDINGCFSKAADTVEDCPTDIECEPERSGWLYTRLLSGLLVGMNTAVIRREVFDLLGGFDESLRIGEDYLFWLKVSRIYEMHALNAEVALYRIHSSSAMNRLDSENHQARLLQVAVCRWGLSNPDGTELAKDTFVKRIAASEFTHGYNHFWHGSVEVARHSFLKAMTGGVLPLRSAAYILLSPFRRLLKS
jgi:glycosyltransferase involved in cell wall biosynthesis